MKTRLLLVGWGLIGVLTPAWAQRNVGSLGRIQPASGIVELMGTPGETIASILVAPLEKVKAGATLATFVSKPLYELEAKLAAQLLSEAQSSTRQALELQEKKRAQLDTATAQTIALQEDAVGFARAKSSFARDGLGRLLKAGPEAYSEKGKAQQEHESGLAKLALETAEKELARIKSERAAELEKAKLELDRLRLDGECKVKQAELRLELAAAKAAQAVLRAPSDGTILDVPKHVGESCGGLPLIRMAELRRMIVRAEVFQVDVLRVKPGMRAKITSRSLPKPLEGTVSSKGLTVIEPIKIVTVVILLDQPEIACELLNLEVDVMIETQD